MWLLASVTAAIVAAAATGYRSLILLACLYGVLILAWWFVEVAP